ncbi:hypothetical protein [Prosthecobacter sp.]|uniref:hypothetical protein n=1 Tax=Prosthecobacter sp. TaxID=1965333 RepID=UPI001E0659CB|nr:hypothetical protein [Prosthecobacter sp.]MCB1278692.1 hypothetical protein [Prosthecobacter sp.]
MKPNLFRELTAALMCAGVLLQSATAAVPSWWTSQGVINSQRSADDYAVLNQGQLKLLASSAWLHMELGLSGGAGPELTQMISGWKLVKPQTDDFAVVNLGQLKAVARPFYERLAGAGLAPLPVWMTQPDAPSVDDFAVVNLGQAKNIFSFGIPQSLGLVPQRLSGNGINDGAIPSGHIWGSGRPPMAAPTAALAARSPSSDTEVAESPVSAMDFEDLETSGVVVELRSASGSVDKLPTDDGWETTGIAYSQQTGEFADDLQSTGALLSALEGLTQLQSGGEVWAGAQGTRISGIRSLHSGYATTHGEDPTTSQYGELLSETWVGSQVQFRLYGSGESSVPRQAWLRIERTIFNLGGVVGRTVEHQPCLIAASAAEATTGSIVSQHWGTSDEWETLDVSVFLPQVIQVNDGDTDGDDIPDFADGFNVQYPDPEDEPDVPETAQLFGVNRGASGHPDERVRFLYSASDPAAVDVQPAADGTNTYTPAPGALRVWRSRIFEWYTTSRNPQSVSAGGDYIPPGEWFNAAELGATHVESVALSQQPHDQIVDVEVDPDGDGPEGPYIAHRYVFTSLGMHLEKVENGIIGQRERRLQPSLPNPTIDLQNVSVTNPRVADDGSGLLVDIALSGKVRSAVCDLTPGEETGTIQSAYASVNDEPLPQSVVSLQVTKGDTPAGQDRPYPYEGSFSHTLSGVKVTEGQNTLGLIVSDPLYHLSGTAEVSFEINATPPDALGGGTGSEVMLELPVAGGTLAADEARLSISVDDEPLVNEVVLKRQAGNALLYRSADGQAVFQFTQAPALTSTAPEALHGFITLPQSGWQGAAFSPMIETEVNSGTFVWSAQEEYGGYWGWSVGVGQVGEAVESGAGEFHAYTLRLMGPMALLEQVRRIHIAGQALPVLIKDGIARVADLLHPDQPVTVAALPMEARQAYPVLEEEEEATSPGMVELGAEESWEEQDLPESFYAGEGYSGAKGRAAVVPGNGMTLMQRVQRQAGVWWQDRTSTGYYKGFVHGFFDNPWSTGKDMVVSVAGISEKAANVIWLSTPMGTIWEMTFGDAYQGEVKAAIHAAQRAEELGAQVGHVLKDWGPEVWDFWWKLNFQVNETVVRSALQGEFPQKEKMGPELRLALELLEQILIMADDTWSGMESYERGYWQGYITFEIVAMVVGAVLTAPEGMVGGAAMLARHAPKVTRAFKFLEILLDRFADVPGIGRLVAKIRGFNVIADKLGDFCFVAGTPVLTLSGLRPIEQIKDGDWVWSRNDETGEWGWRPVVRTFVTHPDTLVHVHYEASGGAVDAEASQGLGLARHAVQPEAAPAEIACTPGHLVHARRSVGGMLAAFVAAGTLAAGDLLTLADGRDAAVQEARIEHAAPGTTFTTYNFTVAGHHTYFAGALPVWVHNDGLDDCGRLGERLVKIIAKKGDDPARYFEYLKEAREAISGTIKSDRIWGNGYKKMTQKMVKAFEDGDITDVDLIPTYNQIKASYAGSTTIRKLKQADTDIHHIVPKSVLKLMRGFPGGLPTDHSLGDVAAVALSKADHAKITKAMQKLLVSKDFRNGSPADKANAIVQWYQDNGYQGMKKVSLAWFKKRSIL